MDRDKLERRRSIRLIVSEAVMVLAVVLTVVILALIVSGYWLNSDFEVERQGLLQIYSVPTGANIDIDGESSWSLRTNTSKVLPSGEHTITLSREGYDTWSKKVNISEGLLYRVHYPRLFLKKREKEKVLTVQNTTFATYSPDRMTLLLANETTKWSVINLEEDKLTPKKIDIAGLFSGVSVAEGADVGVFTGKILSADWSTDNAHVIFKVANGDAIEWILFDINNVKNGINLTREFGANFTKLKILNDSASNLLAVSDGNLHKIDVGAKQISSILISKVASFDYYENEIVFVAKNDNGYYLGLTKLNDENPKKLKNLSAAAKVAISRFYDDKYITVLADNQIKLYKKQDFDLAFEHELDFSPDKIQIGHDGEFIMFGLGRSLAVLDMEAMTVTDWNVPSEIFDWVDNNMIYSIVDGELEVFDFDGLNQRSLAKNVSGHFPVMITENKWLYYLSDDILIREWLIPR